MSVVEKVRYSDEDLAIFKTLIEKKIKVYVNSKKSTKQRRRLGDF